MRTLRFAVHALFTAILFASIATAQAQAAVEFCPATVSVPLPAGAAFGTAARTLDYDMTAMTPRTISATVIADTSAGWYSWQLARVVLTSTTRTMRPSFLPRQFYLKPYSIAASPTLAVTFPLPVTIHHLWVTSANGQPCEVPAFDKASDALPPPPDEVTASASPLHPVATATAAPPPFDFNGCAQPFVNGTVVKPMEPDVRNMMGGPPQEPLAAAVEVALDPSGRLIDTWIYESSGNRGFDGAALRAARLSTYAGAISYCRPVKSSYLFIATVVPGGY